MVRGLQRFGFASCAFLLLLVAGCSNTPPSQLKADYAATLNRYYEGRPLCLWTDSVKFPVENVTPEEIRTRGFDALVDSGLLVRRQAARGGAFTYDLSDKGRAEFEKDVLNKGAGNFCYGRWKVVNIYSAKHDTPATELVSYEYAVPESASWAHEPAIQRAFPQVGDQLARPHKTEAQLLNTTEGWQVAGTPGAPGRSTKPHTSPVSKLKVVFAANRNPGS